MNTAPAKADDHAPDNAKAWFESIQEMTNALADSQPDESRDRAHETIQKSVLSVMVRDGWRMPGGACEDGAEEYEILLTTGGPACRIYGKLDGHGEPETAELQMQDWGTPWTEFLPEFTPSSPRARASDQCMERIAQLDRFNATLLAFARCFYFGE